MDVMPSFMPFIVVCLALMAAGCIAYIAWELTSKDIQKHIDRNDETESPNSGE